MVVIHGYDRKMGARPMARLIQERLKQPLADEILFGRIGDNGMTVKIDIENDDIVIKVTAETPIIA